MKSTARVLGHAIHPMMIVFPLGLLSTAVIFDLVYLFTDRLGFSIAAAYAIGVGVLGGLVAGISGLIDWLAIPSGTRAKRIGAVHGLGNMLVLVLFAISWSLRVGNVAWRPGAWALVLSFAGVVLLAGTGWLGGELVQRLGVSIEPGAHLDAPNSLTGKSVP